MIVARSLQEVVPDANSVVTVGTFDGIHLGHRAIIRELTSRARVRSGRSIVVTFDPHPREIVGRSPVYWLTTLDERISLLQSTGVDIVLVINFTYEFSRMTSREFYEQFVIRGVGAGEVIVGYDHMFGRDREAGIHELRLMGQEYGFGFSVVDPVSIHGVIISSTKIRELLSQGDTERTKEYLGRPYVLQGVVIRGERRGTELGFPTANMRPDHLHQLVPGNGVYCVHVWHEGHRYNGMLNIGVRPTFTSAGERNIEVHIFEFQKMVYDQSLRIEFLKRLREEKKFSSKEQFIEQLQHDRGECLRYLAEVDVA